MRVTIRDGLVSDQFPPRALRLVLEWRDLRAEELMVNCDRLRAGQPPEAISTSLTVVVPPTAGD